MDDLQRSIQTYHFQSILILISKGPSVPLTLLKNLRWKSLPTLKSPLLHLLSFQTGGRIL